MYALATGGRFSAEGSGRAARRLVEFADEMQAVGTKARLSTEDGGRVARRLGVHSVTRYQNPGKRFQPLANGLRLAAVCVLLYNSPVATSLAADSLPTSTLTLAWDASTDTNIANYKLYYGTISGSYTQVVSAGPVTQTTITGLTPGTTYFLAVTASDSTGLESAYSNEISFAVPAGRPDQSLPALSLLRAGTDSVLEWPTNYPGFTLQWSSSPAGAWTDLTSSPSISGSYFNFTNTSSAALQYYRLMK